MYYEECLGLIVEAEQLGYAAVWLSEHHGTPDGFLPSPLVAAAAIAMRTEQMVIGTNVLPLPLHHPLRVAEDAAVVHGLSGGRLVLAVGQGYAPHRAVRIGDGLVVYVTEYDDLPERYALLVEALENNGRDRATFPFVWTTMVHLAESSDQAWEEAAPAWPTSSRPSGTSRCARRTYPATASWSEPRPR